MKKLTLTLGLIALMTASVKANPGYFVFQNNTTDKIFNTNEIASGTGTSLLKSNVVQFQNLRIAIYYNTNGITTNLTDRRAYRWPDNASSGITGTDLYTNTSGIIGFGSLSGGNFSGGTGSNNAYKVDAAITNQFQVRVWDKTYGLTWESFKTNMDAGNVPIYTLYGLSPVFSFLPPDIYANPTPTFLYNLGLPFWNLTNVVAAALPPGITGQPQSVTNVQGTTASFNVTAGGTAPLTYQWQFSGTNLSLATNSTLTLTNVQGVNAGSYTVVVSNTYGMATSLVASLTIVYVPAITTQPQSVTNAVGTTANFNVTATGTALLSYQWQFNGANLSLATNNTLTLTNVQGIHDGNYTVVVSNAYGMATSTVATLTVLSAAAIITQPQSVTNVAGTTASFNVTVTGTDPLSYQWQFNGANLSLGTNDTLTLTNVQGVNVGSYKVVVSNIFGMVTSTVATLTVVYPAAITTQPQSVTNLQGTTASFNVTADGTAPLLYQWQFNGTNLSLATNNSLTLNNVQGANAGSYTVLVGNAYGMATSSVATLTVTYPAGITSQPQSVTNVQGTTASFDVTASGTAPLSYQWQFNGTALSLATNSTLTLNNVQGTNAGSYHVVVSNAYGMATSTVATLTVVYPSVITAQPQSLTNVQGTTASFNVTATGSAPLTYQWQFSGTNLSLATNNTLTLTNVQGVNGGSYNVVVSNAYGMATSTVATLTVVYPAVITAQPQSVTNVQGTTASFDVTASGTAPLTYQWQFNGADLSLATNHTLTLTNVQGVNGGSYDVVVSNAYGMATSTVATLTLLFPSAITAQPQSVTNIAGTTANFNVTASGTAPLTYQWQFNGADLSLATNSALTLTNVQGIHDGSYTVVVSNAYGMATSTVASLTVVYLPAISTQPVSLTNLQGTTASFNVTASGTAPLTYQWQFNGADLSLATNSTLTLTNVQGVHGGSYNVVVSNAYGMATSTVATLTLLFPSAITAQPQSLLSVAGTTANFNVTAFGTAPLSYQWRFNGANISLANNNTLSLTNVQGVNGGGYSVVVSNAYGMATSAVAILTVVYPAAITVQPQSLTNLQGTTASFNVGTTGTAPLSYQWQFNGTDLNLATNSTLTLANVQGVNGGSYKVVVSNAYGMATSTVATLTLLFPAAITAQPQNQTNVLGTTAIFNVTAFGTPSLAYQWYKSVASNQSLIIGGAKNSRFTIPDSQTSDAGYKYYCVVSNAYGMATSTVATLTILYPPAITTQPQSQVNLQGATASFNVAATGDAPLSYQWWFNGTELGLETRATLTLSDVQSSDVGNYSVVVSNAYGMATSTVVTLALVYPPAITAQPQSQTNVLGGTARFNVTATGTAPLTYQWYKSGVSNQFSAITGWILGRGADGTNFIFQIANLKLTDAGNYQVVILNSFGSVTSAVATLTVSDNQGPAITVNGSFGQTVNQRRYTLTGMVTDAGRGNNGVQNVWVNGTLLTNVSGSGEASVPWSQVITLRQGTNSVFILAEDTLGNFTTNLFQLNFVPNEPGIPTLTITAPRSPTYSNVVVVTGTAADAKGVVEVWCQHNSGAWVLASGTNKWSIQLIPTISTNLLSAYAVDTSGNYSKTNSVKFVKLATDTLNVVRVGNGTLSPDLSGKMLILSNKYTMKALPGKGFIFSNWVGNGSVLTNQANLVFTMRSNLTLTANFVTNIFLARKGSYVGLFAPENDVFQADWTNSGSIKLTVTDQGAFSGQLTHQGKGYALAGAFDAGGASTVRIARGKDPVLQVLMNLDLGTDNGVTGTVKEGTNAMASLWADAVLKESQVKASYTVTVESGPTGTNGGTITLTVQPSGIVTVMGSLVDKTILTGSLPLTSRPEVVLYQTLYGGKGMWLGYLDLHTTNQAGVAHWQKLANAADKVSPQGFSVNTRLLLP